MRANIGSTCRKELGRHYNAYNYMVLTAAPSRELMARIPSVIHADGTGAANAREHTDPLTYAYLKALAGASGVEVAGETRPSIGGADRQTPVHAVETLRRAKGWMCSAVREQRHRICGLDTRCGTSACGSSSGIG